MASEAATIFRHGWIYMVANIVNRLGGLVLLPLYTTVLTPTEFGVYALVVVVVDLLSVMVMIGIGNAFTVVYFDHPDEAGRRRVVSTTMLAMAAMVVAMMALAWPGGWAASMAMFGTDARMDVMAVAIAGVGLTAVFELALTYYRVRKRSLACLGLSLGKAVALVGFNLAFLLLFKLGVTGIFLANVAVFSVFGVLLLAMILSANGAAFSGAILRRVVQLGLPYLPQSLLDIANNVVARYLLNILVSTAAVGVFSFGMRLAQILFMFLTASFLQIWSVRRLESQHEAVDGEQSELVFHLFVTLLTAAALGLALATPEILWAMASADYTPVLDCMALLVLAFVLHGVRMHPEVDLMKAKRMKVLPWISAASLAVGTGLAVVLVMRWGLVGAALANLGREVFQLVLTEGVRRRLCPQDRGLNAVRILGILAPAAVAWMVGWRLFGDAVDPVVFAGKVALALVFVVAVVAGPGLGAGGRATLLRLIGGHARAPQSAV